MAMPAHAQSTHSIAASHAGAAKGMGRARIKSAPQRCAATAESICLLTSMPHTVKVRCGLSLCLHASTHPHVPGLPAHPVYLVICGQLWTF